MSRKRKYKYDNNNLIASPNFYMLLILVLIVLQWFKVYAPSVGGVTPAPLPEYNLVNNGGLFIITLFLLIACNCEASPKNYRVQRQRH